jgi:hypothetical protein
MAAGGKGERGLCGDLEEKGSNRADATGALTGDLDWDENLGRLGLRLGLL